MPAPHVVILGGGFGGLDAARALNGAPVRVTLIDRHNYHLFQPLLYQVATASLSPGDVASPIRWILRHQQNAKVLLAEVRGIDVAAKRVFLDNSANDGHDGHDASECIRQHAILRPFLIAPTKIGRCTALRFRLVFFATLVDIIWPIKSNRGLRSAAQTASGGFDGDHD